MTATLAHIRQRYTLLAIYNLGRDEAEESYLDQFHWINEDGP